MSKTSPSLPAETNGNCPECGGNGKIGMYWERCPTCDGTGWLFKPVKMEGFKLQAKEEV